MRRDLSEYKRDRLVGRRVVVRYRIHDGSHSATDVLGVLESWQGGILSVRRSRLPAAGDDHSAVISIPEADVVAAKAIPARPVTRREVRDLEAAAGAGWQALETHTLGGWILRAAGGFTRRANSCVPLAEPGLPVADAVSDVVRWYRDRGLPPAFQVPSLLGGSLEPLLDTLGWMRSDNVLVLTAGLEDVRAGSREGLPPVRIDPSPDDAWLAGYHYRGSELPRHALEVLTNAETVGFASVDEGGRRVAIARGAVSTSPTGRRWLGVTAVEVAPEARRQGLGSHVVAGLAVWATAFGASDAYLQVEEANTGAQAAYRKLGFVDHHAYHYRQAP